MFRLVTETDRQYNKEQGHFYLTQGDSCTIYITPHKDGDVLPLDQIQVCKFKLSNEGNELEFQKECEADTENGRYILRLSASETAEFEIAQHIYEFEYTLVGGEVHTPNRWYFDITEQIEQ